MKTNLNAANVLVQRCITCAIVLSLALNAFLTYRESLDYFFTDTDTLTLIDTSRIQSSRDVARIFTEPVMNGSEFVKGMKYYRPISILSYSLDYALWKLNPFGYHLTDLMLHILVAILVFFVIRSLTRNQVTAWLGALIFINHPILMESVPAPARRHDIIAALFILVSLLLFLRQFSATARTKKYLICSLLSYMLALWAKELAIILPALIFSYWMLFAFPEEESFMKRTLRAVRGSLAFLVVTLLLLAWRIYVLEGIGGQFHRSFGVWTGIHMFFDIVRDYILFLLYPVNFLGLSFSPFPNPLERLAALTALLLVFTLLWVYRRNVFAVAIHGSSRGMVAAKIFFVMVIILSLVGILSYPLIGPAINLLIQLTYYGEGPTFLTAAMQGILVTPLEVYLHNTRYLIIKSCSDLLLAAAMGLVALAAIQQARRINRLAPSTASALYFLVWLMLPLCLFLATLIFQPRYMYIPTIPFSALLALTLVESFILLRKKAHAVLWLSSSLKNNVPVVAKCGGIGALAISLLAYSPLLRNYQEWKFSGQLFETFLLSLSRLATILPQDTIIQIQNLPEIEGIPLSRSNPAYVKSVGDISNYSSKSWLDMNYPGNRIQVAMVHPRPRVIPKNLELDLRTVPDNGAGVFISFDRGNTLPYPGDTALWSRGPEKFSDSKNSNRNE